MESDVQALYDVLGTPALRNGHSIEDAPPSFHTFDKAGHIKIEASVLVDFLTRCGFGKYYAPGATTSLLIRTHGCFVREVSSELIKDYVLEYVRSTDDLAAVSQESVAALTKGANVYFSRPVLETLPALDMRWHRDERDVAYLYFENGFVEIRADQLPTLRPYRELDGHIWKDQAIKRDFELLPEFYDGDGLLQSDFGRFAWNVTRRDPDRFVAYRTVLGYLLHGFKDPANATAICFVDEVVSDVPEGRSGKSLTGKAISQIVPALRIDAKNFGFDSQFRFQDVRGWTQVIEFNDCDAKFNFPRLFSTITDDMQIERKYCQRYTLTFENSPKVLLSSNGVIQGIGGSHDARIVEIEFSHHYHKGYTPRDEFGRRFFNEWDVNEWNRFYNFMARCLRDYLRHGLTTYTHVNLRVRKLRALTSPEFAEFAAERFKTGTRYETGKSELYDEFVRAYPNLQDLVTPHKFTKWLKSYGRVYGYDLNEGKSGSSRWVAFTERPPRP